jgi:hypothetical protein
MSTKKAPGKIALIPVYLIPIDNWPRFVINVKRGLTPDALVAGSGSTVAVV